LVTAYTSFVVVADESYATEGESGGGDGGELPQGGTEEPLLSAIGVVLSGLGGCILLAAMRARRVAA
jgi:hypothetical protein